MRIAQVSEKYGISPETLRYYEKIGLIPKVNKDQSGIRDYTERDCNWINYIKCMRGAGLSIDSLIRYTSLFKKGRTTISERKQILIEQRDEIEKKIKDMQIALDRLNMKIEGYEERMLAYEDKLRIEEEK
ncbi:MAG: MerR family transcriptional regulator [Clostridia bacterium]|nr:MerR family transcriptional regulator [Clostridia bacterium]